MSTSVHVPGDPRRALEERWWRLTREELPDRAKSAGWPIALDHCFQRVLLDNACGGRWTEFLARPAYRNASDSLLGLAVALGEAVLAGRTDLPTLNRQSLEWRMKR